MEDLELVLTDGTRIPIEDASLSGAIVAVFDNKDAMYEVWNSLTPSNLHKVEIQSDSVTVRTMHGVVMDNFQVVASPDGTFTMHIYSRETITGNTTTDSEYVEAAKILLGEEV